MTDTRLADISEFQENIDAGVYIRSGHTCLIVRAHNGNRPDHFWPTRRDYLREFKFDALGWYQYLVDERNSTDQARDFIRTVGDIRSNEFVIVDSEEGSGDQTSRVQAWVDIVDPHYGQPSTVYASESWFADKLSGASHWRRPRWMAAYRSSEPSAPHELWQYNDHSNLPGISGNGGDGNLFHGTAQEFARTFIGKDAGRPSVPKPPLEEPQSVAVGTMPDGRQEVFVELASGEVQHRWNSKEGGWEEWASLGTPGK
jgi:GH25 family lysozyme M1 (1,4-beta-N-acetylmuramidase)